MRIGAIQLVAKNRRTAQRKSILIFPMKNATKWHEFAPLYR